MARTIFILGAGASAAAGAPLMAQFLRTIRDLYENGAPEGYEDDFERVMKAHSLLQSTYAKLRMDYENDIEDLFATFEMIRILDGESEDFLGFEAEQLTPSMRRAIGATIENTMLFPVETGGSQPVRAPHAHFREFVHLLSDIAHSHRPDSHVAILSFNYDLGLDLALESARVPFHYALHEDDAHPGIPYLKLHGSLNWGVCANCGRVISYGITDFQTRYPPATIHAPVPMLVSEHLSDLVHCGTPLPSQPYLVPPTWNKTEYQKAVANVWKAAYRELSDASNIIVCGYSFPPTDQFFRHLLAISLSGGAIIDRFIVTNPNRGSYDRFSAILSDNVRHVLAEDPLRFENSFVSLRGRLNIGPAPWNGYWPTEPASAGPS